MEGGGWDVLNWYIEQSLPESSRNCCNALMASQVTSPDTISLEVCMNRDFSKAKHGTLQLGSIWIYLVYLRFSLSLTCVTLLLLFWQASEYITKSLALQNTWPGGGRGRTSGLVKESASGTEARFSPRTLTWIMTSPAICWSDVWSLWQAGDVKKPIQLCKTWGDAAAPSPRGSFHPTSTCSEDFLSWPQNKCRRKTTVLRQMHLLKHSKLYHLICY